jgi:hypothetical protein
MTKKPKPSPTLVKCPFCKTKVEISIAGPGRGTAYLVDHYHPKLKYYKCVGSNTKCTCKLCKERA